MKISLFQTEEDTARCWEPEPRMHEGHYGFVKHRFPIKGGITMWEAHKKLQRMVMSDLIADLVEDIRGRMK